MTLRDADVDRWSRQILLPGVGGRGQQRLLAARVGLAPLRRPHPIADGVEDLLRRAGVAVLTGAAASDLDLLIDLTGDAGDAGPAGVPLVRGVCRGAAASVLTLVGRPCGRCVSPDSLPEDDPSAERLQGAAEAACAALVAAEVLHTLLEAPHTGRRQRIDLRRGTFAGEPVATAGCPRCRESYR
jgi:hypothetical protein